jgi:hypothetical protein
VDPNVVNPLSVLTFIVAPAILTNASSVMALGTSNRFARAVDRARALAAALDGKPAGADARSRLVARQLRFAGRRALLLVRALTAFYLSLGSFAAATFASLLAAAFHIAQMDAARGVALTVGVGAGVVGVGGLLAGSVLLVWESRMALAIHREETEFVLGGLAKTDRPPGPP